MEYKTIRTPSKGRASGNKREISNFLSGILEKKTDVIKYAFDFTEGRCFYCGRKLYRKTDGGIIRLVNGTSWDHLHPVTDLGLFVKGNILLTCCDCNEERGWGSAKSFYKSKFGNSNNDKNLPLYDTYDEFCAALSRFELPYIKRYPKLYKINFELEHNLRNSILFDEVLSALNIQDILLYNNRLEKNIEPVYLNDEDKKSIIVVNGDTQEQLSNNKIIDDEETFEVLKYNKTFENDDSIEQTKNDNNIPDEMVNLPEVDDEESFNQLVEILLRKRQVIPADENFASETFENIVLGICSYSNRTNDNKIASEVRMVAKTIKYLLSIKQISIGSTRITFANMKRAQLKNINKMLRKNLNIGEHNIRHLGGLIGAYSGNPLWF